MKYLVSLTLVTSFCFLYVVNISENLAQISIVEVVEQEKPQRSESTIPIVMIRSFIAPRTMRLKYARS